MDFALIKRLTVSQRTAPRKRRSGRDARGMYIVEALVAMVISGVIAFALLDMVSGSMRSMDRAGGDSQAYELIEELTEFTRVTSYERLHYYSGQTFNLTLNKSEGAQFENPEFHNRPLLLDFAGLQWQPKTLAKRFDGQLTYHIFEGPENGTLNVAIDLHWKDSFSGHERSLGRVIVVLEVPEASA